MTGSRFQVPSSKFWVLGVSTIVVGLITLHVALRPVHAQQTQIPRRIVAVVPAVTEMLFAIGTGPQVVGVSSFARYPPAVESLPRVGALLDPDIERILSLEPDLVVLYGSQTDAIEQMSRADIDVFLYRHGGIPDATAMLRALGDLTGQAVEADAVVTSIESLLTSIAARVSRRPKPRVLLVMGREPDTLRNVYASGGIGFLHDMIVAAGGENVFAHITREAVQPTSEGILAAAPDVIIEIRAEGMLSPDAASDQSNVWQGLSAIPAVRGGRVHFLTGNDLIVPGPRLAHATERLARVLHPGVFQ